MADMIVCSDQHDQKMKIKHFEAFAFPFFRSVFY